MGRRHRMGTAAMVVIAAAVLLGPLSALAVDDRYYPVLPDLRAEAIAKTDGHASSYDLDLRLDPANRTISGTQRVDFVNDTGKQQLFVPFRLYPNAGYYGEGGLAIERVRVDGELVEPAFAADDTLLSVPLASPLATGESVRISLRYTVTVPVNSDGTFGIFSFDSERGMWMLADWYPILAGWEADRGWVLDPPTPAGDPTFSDVGIYDLSLAIPTGWTLAATGDEATERSVDGVTTWHIVTGPVRELALVIDDDFKTTSRTVGATEITMYTDGNGDADAGAAIAIDEAAGVLAAYSELFGAYPYAELDLVETEMSSALGVSWTGLIYLNGAELLSSPFFVGEQPDRLRFAVAHEVGHQWWGALIGINSNDHAFLGEGLTNYLAVVGIERTSGTAVAAEQLNLHCVQPYVRALRDAGDGIADVPISQATTGPSRGALAYGKAALGFLAIRQAIGDDAFFTAIKRWAEEFAYRTSGPEELLAAFEAETDTDVAALWSTWFESATTTEADVLALIE